MFHDSSKLLKGSVAAKSVPITSYEQNFLCHVNGFWF